MRRNAPLYNYLREEVPAEEEQVDLEFEQIERVINAGLPRSAYQHRAWWANTPSHAQPNAWVSAGWRVERVAFDNGTVTLTRTRRCPEPLDKGMVEPPATRRRS